MRFVSSDSSLNHVSKVTNSDQLDEVFDRQMAALLANKMASIVISRDGAGLPRKLEADQIHFIRPSQGSTSQQRYDEMGETHYYVESLRRNHKSGYSLLGGSLPTRRVRKLAYSVCRGSSTGPGFKWFRITFGSSHRSMMESLHSKTQYSWPQRTTMLREALAEDPAGYFGVESIPVVEPRRYANTSRQTKADQDTQEDQSRVVSMKWRDRLAPQGSEQVPLPKVSRASAFVDPGRSYSSVAAMNRSNKRVSNDVDRDTMTQTGQNDVDPWKTALLQSTLSVQDTDSRPVGKIILKRPQPAQTTKQDSSSQSQSSCAQRSSSPRRDVYKQGTDDTQHSEHGVNSKAAQKFELLMKYNVEADIVRRKIRESLVSGAMLDGSGETLTLQRANVPIPSEGDMARGKEYVDLCNRGDGVDRPYLLETWKPDSAAGTARWKYRASWNEVVSAGESLLWGHDVHWVRASEFDPDCDRSSLARDPIPASPRRTQTTSNPQMKAVASITDRSTENTRAVKSTEGILPPESHAHQRLASLHEAIVDRLAIPEQSPGTANCLSTKQLVPIPILQWPSYDPEGAYGPYCEPVSIHHDATGQVVPQMLCNFDPLAQWYSVPVFDQRGSDKYQPSHSWVPETAPQKDQSSSSNRPNMETEQRASNLSPPSSSPISTPAGFMHLLEDDAPLRTPLFGQTSSQRDSIDHMSSDPASIATVPSRRRSSSLPYKYVFPVTEARPSQRTNSAKEEKGPLNSLSGPDELTGEEVFAWLSRRGNETLTEAEKQAHLPPGLSSLLYRPDDPDRSYNRDYFADDDKSDEKLTQGTTDTATVSVPTIRVQYFPVFLASVAPFAEPDEALDTGSTDVLQDGQEQELAIRETRTENSVEGAIRTAMVAEPSAALGGGAGSSTRSDGTPSDGPHEATEVDRNRQSSWADMVESELSWELPQQKVQ